jgi:hypothetical protein
MHDFLIVIDALNAGKRKPQRFCSMSSLDIEVVQNLKVVGNEAT